MIARATIVALALIAPAAAAQTTAPTTTKTVAKPTVVAKPIPFGSKRKAQTRAYSRRHYGRNTYVLKRPRVIVEHYTENLSFSATFNTFAPNLADPELHELPGTCAHFVIDRDGAIYQLVPLTIVCRHTVGLNWTAIGIEHVGTSDAMVLNNTRQMSSSLALTRWLRCTLAIEERDVIGHNESLSSPYHREKVKRLQRQTHQDFPRGAMDRYRKRLAQLGACPGAKAPIS